MSRFTAILDAARRGDTPPRVALAHLMVEAPDASSLDAALASAAEAAATRGERDRLVALRALFRANAGAWETVRRAFLLALHDHQPEGRGSETAAAWARVYDALARDAPEVGVALHSLGDADALAAATREVVADLVARGLVGETTRVVEVGCGTGRFEEALAPLCASVTGLDVSEGMLARARARCAHLPNVAFARSTGVDLAGLAPGSADLVLFVDSFPYIVMAGEAAVAAHWRDAARALAPGGALVIANYSYAGDPAGDTAAFARRAEAEGLAATRIGERPFRLWDGAVFEARRLPSPSWRGVGSEGREGRSRRK